MTTTTSTTQPISQPSYACLRVGTSSPTGLLKHFLVLVLAHLLAPLLDYRAQSNSQTRVILKKGGPDLVRPRESYRKAVGSRSQLEGGRPPWGVGPGGARSRRTPLDLN